MDNDVILEKLKGIEKLFNEKFNINDKSHQEIKECLEKKASIWTENALKIVMGTMFVWIITQILDIIPRVQALF